MNNLKLKAMKNLKALTLLLTIGLFAACSEDDSATTVNSNNSFAGTYTLTAINTPKMIDFDLNGIPSANLMEEVNCYQGSRIVLNEDGNYTSLYSFANLEAKTGCDFENSEGMWNISGNELGLVKMSAGEMQEDYFTVSGRQLKKVLVNASYPDRDENNEPIYSTGDVILTYTKNQ